MTDRLTGLRVFVRVAHRGSFSAAARELGMSQPSVSRIVAELEKDVGVGLITRSTRGLILTEPGMEYLARIEPILRSLEEADHAVRGSDDLRGRLRIAMSTSFGVREIIPRLPQFAARHPDLGIDLVVSDARQDLIAEGVNVALRLGPLPDSTSIARKLAEAPRLLVAAPGYVARAGTLDSPTQLASHSVIVGPGAQSRTLSFRNGDRRLSIRVDGRLTAAANEAATAAAVAGLGITVTSLWGCRAELERGSLVQVLPQWTMPVVEFHAMFPPGRTASVAARAFVDYLAAQFNG